MSAERAHHLVEAHRRREVVGVFLAVDVLPNPLVYVRVLEHHPHDWQLESDGGFDVHSVESERPVSLQADDGLIGMDYLRRQREGDAHAHASGHAGVHALARIPHRDHLPRYVHSGRAVRHENGIFGHVVAYLFQDAVVAERHRVGVQHRLDGLRVCRRLFLERAEPRRLAELHRRLVQRVEHLPHDHLGVAHEPDFGGVVDADFRRLDVHLNQLVVVREARRLSEVEYPVEARAHEQNGVRALQRLRPRRRHVHRMVGRQYARAHRRG